MNEPWWCNSIASQSELLNKTLAYSVCHAKIIVLSSLGSSFFLFLFPLLLIFLNKTHTQQNLSFLAKEAKPSEKKNNATLNLKSLLFYKIMMYHLLANITKILKKSSLLLLCSSPSIILKPFFISLIP